MYAQIWCHLVVIVVLMATYASVPRKGSLGSHGFHFRYCLSLFRDFSDFMVLLVQVVVIHRNVVNKYVGLCGRTQD